MPSYLSIQALTVSYGGPPVLDRVSLDVERGEMVALLGSSGCGKTTLLRAIAGFVIPDSGMIRVPGLKSASALIVGLDHVAPVPLGDFLIDRHEVTNAQYRAFVNAGGYTRRELWTEPFVRDGRTPIPARASDHRPD